MEIQNPPAGQKVIALGMGCFWGAERRMRQIPSLLAVEVGYANGDAAITDYRQVLATEKMIQAGHLSVRNHAEVVHITYDDNTDLKTILALFWESHDPTQGNRQGNDIGSNYRSGIYTTSDEQIAIAQQTLERYQQVLTQHGFGTITTEIVPLENYNRAEEEHQRYLQKYPHGYCGLGGLGIAFPSN